MQKVDGRAAIWSPSGASSLPFRTGRVSTYGEVAKLAGLPRGARQVGRALGQAPASLKLPWYRVIGAGGRIALAEGLGRLPHPDQQAAGRGSRGG